MTQVRLTESVQFGSGSRVRRDPQSGEVVIDQVKFLGPRSTNRNPDGTVNVYAFESRRARIGLYEGAAVFVNHDRVKTTERAVEEKIGRLRGCVAQEAGNYGSLHLNPKHPLTEKIAWDAEHSPDSLGLSHDAQGLARVDGGDRFVDVTGVASVDIVCGGATTSSLFESQENPMDPKPTDKPAGSPAPAPAPKPAELSVLEERMAKLEESNKALLESAKTERVESDKLRVQLATRERKDKVDALLLEAKLPAHAVTDVFRAQLLEAKDDAAAKALIEDRRRISWHVQPNTRPAGDPGAKPIESQADFLESVAGKGK